MLSLKDFESVVIGGQKVAPERTVMLNVQDNFGFLASFHEGKVIYGINTGFGPMAQYRISAADRHQLQLNLIRSHASGMGTLLGNNQLRALMLARYNTLSLGFSGIHQDTLQLLATLLNAEAYPCVYAHGGVGASGDLVQLAHLALGLIGEGEFVFRGHLTPAPQVFEALGLSPMAIHIREGLALLNGTSAMTGIGALNVIYARRAILYSTLLSAIINEVVSAFDDHFSEALNNVKLHGGQREIARWMRVFTKGSALLRDRSAHWYKAGHEADVFEEQVQECYSVRCVPQIAGAILDTITNAASVVERELNSVNDNPVIDHIAGTIYHGGNFHGDYVSLEMDKLKLVVTKLSMLAERQLNFLLNPALNKRLPPFLNAGKPGLNFGIQGMQYPATSNVAENQSLSTSLYIHSIPNNNDNQDIVSMGCNAAMACSRVINNTFEVLAVEAVALAQAIDVLQLEEKISLPGKWLYNQIRNHMPVLKQDIAPSAALRDICNQMQHTDIEHEFNTLLHG